MSSNDRGRRKNKVQKQRGTDDQDDLDNESVVPTSEDVLCGRGRTHFLHPGNRQFRDIVGKNLGTYLEATTKSQKTTIINDIANEAMSQGARFLKQRKNSTSWHVAGDKRVRDKVRRDTSDPSAGRFILLSTTQVTNPVFGQVAHALRDASDDKSRTIKNIHLDLMQQRRTTLEPEPARLTRISTDLSVAEDTQTSLYEMPDVTTSNNESNDSDSKHVAERHAGIYNVSTITSKVYRLSPHPAQITGTTKEEKTEGALMDDCSPYARRRNLSQGESSSCSSLGTHCLDLVNDMDANELDFCLNDGKPAAQT